MALPEFISGVGPFQANTDEPYRYLSPATLGDDGITIVTIGGKDHFHWDGTATTATHRLTERISASVNKTYRWGCVEQFRIQASFGSVGNEVEICRIGNLRLYLVCSTDTSHYKWRIKEALPGPTIATGSTEYAIGTTFHAIRLETDGSTVTLHVDSTQEIAVTDSNEIANGNFALVVSSLLQDGQTVDIHNIQICQSNDRGDRPDHQDMTGGIITLTGDKVSAQYGVVGSPSCTDGAGSEAEWDDWETGDADDDTNLYGLEVWSRGRASLANKTISWDIIMEDAAGNIRSVAQSNLLNNWKNAGNAGFGDGPNITGWTSLVLNDSGVGVRSPNTNGANDEHTAILAEWFGIGGDAPPVAALDWLPNMHRPRIIEPVIHAHT